MLGSGLGSGCLKEVNDVQLTVRARVFAPTCQVYRRAQPWRGPPKRRPEHGIERGRPRGKGSEAQ